MKKTITFLVLIICSLQNWAQEIDPATITTWFGSGSKKAYLIIDFNDGTANESLIWGYKYPENSSPTIYNMLQELQNNQLCFSFEGSTTFLDYVFFHDKGDDSGSDWWKVWGGSSFANLSMNSGISSRVQENYFYALSYGFMCGEVCDAPPTFPVPAPSCSNLNVQDISNSDLSVAPNPFVEVINIKLNYNTQPSLLSIYTLDGRLIKQMDYQDHINLSNLPTGVYLVNIKTTKGTLSKKITKK